MFVLPFKKIAKLDVSAGEIAAMEFVQANTTVPIPKSEFTHGSLVLDHPFEGGQPKSHFCIN